MMEKEGNSINTHANLLFTITPHFSEVCLPKGAVTKNMATNTTAAIASQMYEMRFNVSGVILEFIFGVTLSVVAGLNKIIWRFAYAHGDSKIHFITFLVFIHSK